MKLLAAAALVLALALPAHADNEALCNRSIGKSVALLRKAHQKRISKCLRFANYACPLDSLAIQQSENRLRARLTEAGSACDLAVHVDAVPLASFGPESCPASWNECDALVPSIATLADLADCLVCIEAGSDARVRGQLDFPEAIENVQVRGCVRGLYEAMGQAVRVSMHQVESCAKEAERKPFACPVEDGPGSKLATLLDKMPKIALRCIEEGSSSISEEVQPLCNGSADSTEALSQCFQTLTRCLACEVANSTWGQAEDCISFSGSASCDGTLPPD